MRPRHHRPRRHARAPRPDRAGHASASRRRSASSTATLHADGDVSVENVPSYRAAARTWPFDVPGDRHRSPATSPGAATGSSSSSDHGRSCSTRPNVEQLTDVTLAHPRRRVQRAGTIPRSITSSCSARRDAASRCHATSCSAPARPTTARRAAPAPARSSPASPPTASSRKARSWLQESIIGSLFGGSFRWLDRERGHHRADDHRPRLRQRAKATLLLDARRSVLLGHSHLTRRVVIVGGGVIGLCAALSTALRRGHRVTVVERDAGAAGCSFGNAGMIVPSHFMPLAAPGMVALGLKWMWNPESPVLHQAAPELGSRRRGRCGSGAPARASTSSAPRRCCAI